MRALILVAAMALLPVSAATAQQTETLADIRQDASVLFVELRQLRQELNTTGPSDVQVTGSVLDRMEAIEAELSRIIAKSEELEFGIARVVEDGTNRLGDIDFRLCELESDCDVATLEPTARLGGDAVPSAPSPDRAPPPATDAAPLADGELAVSEEADFIEARDALEAEDYSGAAQLFAAFRETYPRGPLEAAALVGEGRALDGAGDVREAARRFLQAFSDYPDARVAPEALWRLGVQLGRLGSVSEACITLAEVEARYPGSEFGARASDSRAELDCS